MIQFIHWHKLKKIHTVSLTPSTYQYIISTCFVGITLIVSQISIYHLSGPSFCFFVLQPISCLPKKFICFEMSLNAICSSLLFVLLRIALYKRLFIPSETDFIELIKKNWDFFIGLALNL